MRAGLSRTWRAPLRHSRIADSPVAAKAAEFLIRSMPRPAAYALLGLAIAAAMASGQQGNTRSQTQNAPRQEAPIQENQNPPQDNRTNPTGAPPGVAAPVDPKTYKVGAGDILGIRVWGEAELSGPVQVRPDGMITLPLVGELKASDLTPEALTASITEALTKFINKPQVIVSVNAVLSKKYYISGEVGRTGSFPLVVPTTVVEALSNAGGFREFANKKKIIIMRNTERLKFNYNDYLKGRNLSQNINLQDGDHIYVP